MVDVQIWRLPTLLYPLLNSFCFVFGEDVVDRLDRDIVGKDKQAA